MQQLDARGKDIDELVLTLNDDAGEKLGAPIMVEALPFECSTSSDSLEMRVIKILKDIEWKKNGIGRTQIFDDFAKAGVTSHRDQETYLNKALDMGVLEQPKRRGPYFFNKKLADGWGADPLGGSTPGNDKAPF